MYFENSLNKSKNTFRQLPSASTFPGSPTMPTEPVAPIFHVPSTTAQSTTSVAVSTPGAAPVLTNIGYLQAYLRTLIGKRIRIEFLVGTNTFIDRGGVLEEVGISYVVLRDLETNNRIVADLYSIKFVTVFE